MLVKVSLVADMVPLTAIARPVERHLVAGGEGQGAAVGERGRLDQDRDVGPDGQRRPRRHRERREKVVAEARRGADLVQAQSVPPGRVPALMSTSSKVALLARYCTSL